MTAEEIRQKFLEFFKAKRHTVIPSAPLVPENDPTVLFTTAGMHPLVPYLLGEDHPGGKRVANIQICLRTDDINEIGDNRHLTFFEMLGNWSFGDYFKKEAIEWSFEFLTGKSWLGLDPKKIYVSVFAGDVDASRDESRKLLNLRDEESIKIWQDQFTKVGVEAKVGDWQKGIKGGERIFLYGKNKNWWGPAGAEGPCGPDTEMFYDSGKPHNPSFGENCHPNCDCGRFVEIWNDVFMQYNKKIKNQKSKIKIINQNAKMEESENQKEYEFVPLKQKNVDTGMGLERVAAIKQNKETLFETELFWPIIESIGKLTPTTYSQQPPSYRIIADHLRAAVFILAENIEPSNVDRGYVSRRLIRRAIRYGKQIGIKSSFTHKIAEVVIDLYKDPYLRLKKNQDFIIEQLVREEEKFGRTLEKGLKELQKIVERKKRETSFPIAINTEMMKKESDLYFNLITGKEAFHIYSTYGFPFEMIKEEIERLSDGFFSVSEKEFKEEFNEEMKKHQELSRTASAGMFKGGLSDHSEIATKYHTATHLLLASLRQVLGEHIFQRGSNITTERLRFDFSHPEKMTPGQIKQVEDLVNQKIQEGLPVKIEEMAVNEAKAQGAIGVFEQKYGERVKVYTIGFAKNGAPFSREICGGPHMESTGALGKFKIIKEEASSAGVRRIKAVLE